MHAQTHVPENRRARRRRWLPPLAATPLVLAGTLAGMAPLRALASPLNAGSTITFAYTAGEQSFVVPAGATMMQVTVVGAAGGDTYYAGGSSANNAARGGAG